MHVPLTITVNGQRYEHQVEPRLLLVHFLREVIGATGTKIGCDTSQCGACTVLLDGVSMKSCTALAVQADGYEVTTIEGLANGSELHPIQDAFWEKHGLQCGFCTPGMILASVELLSDYQVTIPELGTIRATTPPIVIITSNRTRELHDALKRRCLYWWIDYPDFEKEHRIIPDKVPEAPARLAEQVTRFVQELRTAELYKVSGISETLDWIAALVALDRHELDRETIDETLGLVLKTREDLEAIRGERAQALFERSLAPTGT